MYPQPDLILLDRRKQALVGRIRLRRAECAAHFGVVLKPVSWADGLREKWKALSPVTRIVAMSAGFFAARKMTPRLGGLLGWAPLVRTLFRVLR